MNKPVTGDELLSLIQITSSLLNVFVFQFDPLLSGAAVWDWGICFFFFLPSSLIFLSLCCLLVFFSPRPEISASEWLATACPQCYSIRQSLTFISLNSQWALKRSVAAKCLSLKVKWALCESSKDTSLLIWMRQEMVWELLQLRLLSVRVFFWIGLGFFFSLLWSTPISLSFWELPSQPAVWVPGGLNK